MLVVDLLGDLYATTWWVPMADAGLQQWPGGWAVESAAAKAWLAHGAAAAQHGLLPAQRQP